MRVPYRLMVVTAIAAGVFSHNVNAQTASVPAGNAFVFAASDNAAFPLPNADKDAGLVASALARKDYNVLGVRNLDQVNLKAAIAEFETRIKSSPSAPVFVYFSGPAVQAGQENYLLTSDSNINDLKTSAVSLNVLTSELARISSGPKLIVVDGARLPQPPTLPANLTPGLALPERVPNTLIIFNNTPGLSTFESTASINAFAVAWFEAIGNGAPSSQDLTDLVILRTFEMSKGKQAPWSTGKHEKSEAWFASANSSAVNFSALHSKMLSELNQPQGYAATLLRHSIASYEEYILVQIQNPMTQIARTLLAPIREANIWREAASKPTTSSLWAYLKLYPRGLHAAEARAMLVQLGQTPTPPQDAALLAFTTNPPMPDELSLLVQTTPYRLDDTALDLQIVAAAIRPLVPDVSAQDQLLSKPLPSASHFGLPLPQIDANLMARIQLPSQLPAPPAPPVPPEPKLAKKPVKSPVPAPPQRPTPEEQPALITITIPFFGVATPGTPPATNEAPAPAAQPAPAPAPTAAPAPKVSAQKPILKKPATDVFEQTFDTSPAQQALPY